MVNILGHQEQAKLSKLQRVILKQLDTFYYNHSLSELYSQYGVDSKTLSWAVAKEYKSKAGENFLNRDQIIEFNKRKEEESKQYFKDEAPEFLNFINRVWTKRRYTYPLLLPRFRASLSRSLKRLEDRGLIIRRKGYVSTYDWSRPKTVKVFLTSKGHIFILNCSTM